jgi:glycine betaine/proline transport system substrate-binding protein
MTKTKTLATTTAIALALTLGAGAAQACELDRPVRMADGNWDAIQVFNSIAARILETGYECETEMVTGAMVPLFAALGRGDVDVFMDVWIPNNQEVWAETQEDGAVELGVMYNDATEGWYVPRFVIEGDADRGIEAMAPDLQTVADLADHWELFTDPEDPDMGRFLNCPIGWGCEQRNNDRLVAYGLDETYVNFRPGTGAALDSAFASANRRGVPVLGYYWEPTWLLGVHDMVKLDEPACTDDETVACAFSQTPASVVASGEFVEAADALEAFFAAMQTSSAEVSAILAYMQENDADRDAAAEYYLRTFGDTWSAWVTDEAAARINDAL